MGKFTLFTLWTFSFSLHVATQSGFVKGMIFPTVRVETEIPKGTLSVVAEQGTLFSFELHVEGKHLFSGVGAGTKFSQFARRFSLFQRFAPEILVFLYGL